MANSDNNWDVNSQHVFRVDKVHGGEVVEEIEKPELMNEPGCTHVNLVRDATETEFDAFVCQNPKCGIVIIFNKGE